MATADCTHIEQIEVVTPSAEGCEECLKINRLNRAKTGCGATSMKPMLRHSEKVSLFTL